MNVYAEYIRTIPLDLDIIELAETCAKANSVINERFAGYSPTYKNKDNAPLSTSVFKEYNLLLLPLPGVYELYEAIKVNFRRVSGTTKPHFIGCWLNYYTENGFLGWHKHWEPETNSWHGYFCVNAEPSITSYRLYSASDEIHIENKNNMLVLSPSGFDEHRTHPWLYKDTPRVTIAFDIVPQEYISLDWFNHWIPI
jgi:hypothetical protein